LGLVARKLFPVDFVVCAAESYLQRYGWPEHPSGLGISCLPARLAVEAIAARTLVELLPEWKYVGALQGIAWILHQPVA